MKKYIYILVIFFLLINNQCLGQSIDLNSELKNQVSAFNDSTKSYASDKLFIQFDKPYYAINDTIWFKAYVLNSAYLSTSEKSGFLYVDIADGNNKIVKQYKTPISRGVSWGTISLDEGDFVGGSYVIRAYTNWMRNFSDNYFFYKHFYITSTKESWLITRNETLSAINGVNSARVRLQFCSLDKKPLVSQTLDLHVNEGNSHIFQKKLQTDANGWIDVNFTAPRQSSSLELIAENEKKNQRAVIPLILNRPADIDVQFFPEGGKMVTGLPARFGVKAIGEDGRGIDISGIIIDQNQQQVAVFKTIHGGMGGFSLLPEKGRKYTAKVTLADGTTKDYPLPVQINSGTALQIKNSMGSDSVEVFVTATNDIVNADNNYFLIVEARGIVCYAAIVNFKKDGFVKRKIAKSLFPTGVAHFILTTANDQPLNERLTFVDHDNNLNIQIKTNKSVYAQRDSIHLRAKVTDNSGTPVIGSFSLAVTDDAQVKIDSTNAENIVSRFLLTSELKGNVEDPSYYLPATDKDKWQALDNLLLTQGWVDYEWKQLFKRPIITYQPERQFEVTGYVKNVFNKPVKGTDILLFSKTPTILMDTITDKSGRFAFDRFPKIDTPVFILKAVNRHGKSFNVDVRVDEIKPPTFASPRGPEMIPWYVNSDTTLLNYTKLNAISTQPKFTGKGIVLKGVVIKAKKEIKGSENLNGTGNADLVLDEKDMEKAGKKNWLQLFQENLKGFREGTYTYFKHDDVAAGGGLFKDAISTVLTDGYFIKYKKIEIIVDGIPLNSISLEVPTLLEERRFLESRSAEDIKGIELNFSHKYTDNYIRRYIGADYDPGMKVDYAFIEITTRAGNGPFLSITPGMYLFKPLPISWPKKFYKPKYTVSNNTDRLADLRSTIAWEPNVVTNSNGEATISFFTADKPSTYTLIMQGTDMKGNMGFKVSKIYVSKTNEKSK